MTKPLDIYDLRDWEADSIGCFKLAISEMRKAGVIAGKYKPINLGEFDLVWGW